MRLSLYFILVIILSQSIEAFPQEKDTVWIQGKSILILGDTSLFIANDTILIVPDTVAFFLKSDSINRSNRFYRRMKKMLSKNGLTSEIFHMIFEDPEKKKNRNPQKKINQVHYAQHIGKIINEIKISKLAVFGTDINDTTEFKNDSRLLRWGNETHNYTRRNVVKNHLFFTEGDLLDPVKLEDSERTLRNLPYIKDARVLIDPIDEDKVNVVVVVKDTWSLNPGFAFQNFNKWKLVVEEKNFLGLGHEVYNELIYDTRDKPAVGYRGLYRIRNIAHSFIIADFTFSEADDFMNRGIRVFRDYVTPDIELAGGVEISINGYKTARVLQDTIVEFDLKYQFQDAWLSHAYPVGARSKRKRLVTGARIIRYNYLKNPETSPDSNYMYFNRDQYLFNIGLSKRTYEKSRLIYGYGRTEDIPIGYLISFTAGKEYNQYYDRWYGQLTYAVGGYLGRLGYFRPSLQVGSFYRNNHFEQGMLSTNLTYFSYLYHLRRFAFRQFFNLNYLHGFRRFDNEFIDINNTNGIRGLKSVELLGTKKLVFRSESVFFTPFYLLGFRMAIFGFLDLATIVPEGANILKSKFYQGFGLGFRFRNENLAIKSISIQFGFYPNAPADARYYDMRMIGQSSFRDNDFIVEPPEVLEFR